MMRLSASSKGTGSGPGIGFLGLGEVMAIKRVFQRVRRSFPKRHKESLAPLANEIGWLVLAANAAHGVLHMIFVTIMDKKDPRLGGEMWNALRSDKAQRDLLVEAARYSRNVPDSVFHRLEWAADKIGKLSAIRNDAAHTPFMVEWGSGNKGKVFPQITSIPTARGDRISAQPKIEKYFKTAAADLNHLAAYCYMLLRILYDSNESWPNKPRLLSKLK